MVKEGEGEAKRIKKTSKKEQKFLWGGEYLNDPKSFYVLPDEGTTHWCVEFWFFVTALLTAQNYVEDELFWEGKLNLICLRKQLLNNIQKI